MATYSTSEKDSSDRPWQQTAVSQSDKESDEIHYVAGTQQLTSLPGATQDETTPLIAVDSGRDACEMVGGPPQTTSKSKNSLIGQIRVVLYHFLVGCPRRVRWVALFVVYSVFGILLLPLWGLTAISSSFSTDVYSGDVVNVGSVSGVLFSKTTFSTKTTDQFPTAEFLIFYTEDSPTEQDISSETFSSKNFSFPQGLIVAEKQQNYFLKGTKLFFIFSVENPSQFANLAKICQFTSRADYEDITNDPPSNETIANTERKGTCKPILEAPNQFYIHRSGYYWYVLSTPLSPDDAIINVRTSYEYNLTKVAYNITGLSNPHKCEFLNGEESECTITDSVLHSGSTMNVLALLTFPDSSEHYKVTISQKKAIAIALVTFIPSVVVLLILFFLTLFLIKRPFSCCKY
jgi:hypothetical protein